MTKKERARAIILCDEYHKDDPDWELIREIICELAGKKLKSIDYGKPISIQEIWRRSFN